MTQPPDPQQPGPSSPEPGQQPHPQQQQQGQPPAQDPGRVLGIVGLILAFFCAVVGLVISIIAVVRSKKAGFTNVPAIIGIVVGILATTGWSIGGVAIGNTAAKCAELGPGVHQVGGVTYTCG